MNVEPLGEGAFQRRDVGHVGQHAQLDLAVVGRDQLLARLRDEGGADLRPSRVRIGMFCRFGSVEESRPVEVEASEKQVWMRPVSASMCCGSESV